MTQNDEKRFIGPVRMTLSIGLWIVASFTALITAVGIFTPVECAAASGKTLGVIFLLIVLAHGSCSSDQSYDAGRNLIRTALCLRGSTNRP